MDNINITKAWKDENYRKSLTPEQQALLPANPAGLIELDEDVLENLRGLGKDFSMQNTQGVTTDVGCLSSGTYTVPVTGIKIFGIPIC